MEHNSIRVMIVEDDPDWLRGLKRIVNAENDMEVVAETSFPEEAQPLFAQCEPDVILMDIMLSGHAHGLTLTKTISEMGSAEIIVLSSLEEKKMMIESLQLGAVNYMVKSDFRLIPDAIRKAYDGTSQISSEVARHVRDELKRLRTLESDFELIQLQQILTPMEIEILKQIEKGCTQTEIAESFYISLRTVKNHVNHILHKLDEKSSKDAAKKVKKLGLF